MRFVKAMIFRAAAVAGIAAHLAVVPVFAQTVGPASAKPLACEALTGLKVSGFNMVIKHAAVVPAGPIPPSPFMTVTGSLPEYCRADGVIDERVAHGKPYAIGFAL